MDVLHADECCVFCSSYVSSPKTFLHSIHATVKQVPCCACACQQATVATMCPGQVAVLR